MSCTWRVERRVVEQSTTSFPTSCFCPTELRKEGVNEPLLYSNSLYRSADRSVWLVTSRGNAFEASQKGPTVPPVLLTRSSIGVVYRIHYDDHHVYRQLWGPRSYTLPGTKSLNLEKIGTYLVNLAFRVIAQAMLYKLRDLPLRHPRPSRLVRGIPIRDQIYKVHSQVIGSYALMTSGSSHSSSASSSSIS